MPTLKQKRAIEKLVETRGSVSAAMREAGYSEKSAKNPSNLTNSKAWEEYMEKFLSDADLAKKHHQLLNATSIERINFNKRETDEDIEAIVEKMPGYELLHIVRDEESSSYSSVYAYVKAPDNMAQDKALDKAYKLKGSYAPEKSITATFNLNDEQRNKAKSAIKNIAG